MKITRLEIHILRAPDESRPYWVSNFIVPRANEILVRMHTDEGIEGIGIATSYTPIEAAIKAFKTGIGELVIGEDPLAPERLYQRLFALSSQRIASERGWSREAIVRISAAIDIAAWDIVGKFAKLPLYRLFGGYRTEVPCYVTCCATRSRCSRRRATPASRARSAVWRSAPISNAWRWCAKSSAQTRSS